MKATMKRRLVVVTGLIVIVLVVVLAIVGGNATARSVSVSEAVAMGADTKIQVTGNVVKDSFDLDDSVLSFRIYDPEVDPAATQTLEVRYDGGISDTFGNDVVAICTGKKNDAGTLVCSELVTKCPSKYESATDALSVSRLLNYGDEVFDVPVKVSGALKDSSLGDVSQGLRMIIVDEATGDELGVDYDGALPDGIADGARVVLVGSLGADGRFRASDVALEG